MSDLYPLISYDRIELFSISTLDQVKDLSDAGQFLFSASGNRTMLDEMMDLGDVFILLCDAGTQILVKPYSSDEKGLVYDASGEPSLLSEIFDCHPELTWDTHRDLMEMLIQVEPSIPFDREMNIEGPYSVALLQYPDILHEERTLPEQFSHLAHHSSMTP